MQQRATPGDWAGGEVSERATCVLCPNPSPMTLDGTNTWVLAEPGSDEHVVVDPGPLDDGHLHAVAEHVAARGGRVALVLLTHGHADHAEGAARFAGMTGAPVQALVPDVAASGADALAPGDVVRVGGLEVAVIATPGHTRDSVSFLLPAENRLLTGDTILGRGTTVVAHPDGVLADYLDSLARLERMTGSGQVTSLAPGHGPVVADAAGTVRYYLEHRRERLDQVAAAVEALHEEDRERGEAARSARAAASGPFEAPDAWKLTGLESDAGRLDLADRVVERVYADVPRAVWPAARLSVLAQLEYLAR